MSEQPISDEAGSSLIEVLAAVAVLGFIISALTGAIFLGMRTTHDTHTSLDQSNTEQLVTTYVAKDVQAAESVRTSGTSTCSGQPLVLETTTRSDPLATTADVVVAYSISGSDLIRQVCGPSPSTNDIAHDITSFSASGTNPVSVTVGTAASPKVGAYSWTFQVRRRSA